MDRSVKCLPSKPKIRKATANEEPIAIQILLEFFFCGLGTGLSNGLLVADALPAVFASRETWPGVESSVFVGLAGAVDGLLVSVVPIFLPLVGSFVPMLLVGLFVVGATLKVNKIVSEVRLSE